MRRTLRGWSEREVDRRTSELPCIPSSEVGGVRGTLRVRSRGRSETDIESETDVDRQTSELPCIPSSGRSERDVESEREEREGRRQEWCGKQEWSRPT